VTSPLRMEFRPRSLCCARGFATPRFVHGNHEFYGSDRNFVVAITKQAQAENPNLVWLDNSGIQLSGFNPSTSSSPIPRTPSSSGAARHGPVMLGTLGGA
jgi:hypothetical protein